MSNKANEVPITVGSRHRADTSQFVAFELDGQAYAFPIEKIREIVILDHVTPVPQVASHVDGVTNLRGQIIPIVHLRCLFQLPRKSFDEETRTIVVQVGERTIGCTVDSVSQVLRVAHSEIQEAPETIASAAKHAISGFARMEQPPSDHEERASTLMILLDVESLLTIDHLQDDVMVAASTRATQLASSSSGRSSNEASTVTVENKSGG
ncbi:MAG: chemotaxis protein CheW [Planctomycetota bacterium]